MRFRLPARPPVRCADQQGGHSPSPPSILFPLSACPLACLPTESVELLSEFVALAPEEDAEDVQKVRALLRGLRQQGDGGGGGDVA